MLKYNVKLMIINEGFFKDIDITDDELSADVGKFYESKGGCYEYDSAYELLENHMFKEYTHCVSIYMNHYNNIFMAEQLWDDVIGMNRRLGYMLDTYGLKHSCPVYLDLKHIKYYTGDLERCNIIDMDGTGRFGIITPLYKNKDELCQSDFITTININVYFDMPEFKTYKSAYGFFKNLINSIQRGDTIYYTFDVTSSGGDSLGEPRNNPYLFIMGNWKKKWTHESLYDILVYTFPDDFYKLLALRSQRKLHTIL